MATINDLNNDVQDLESRLNNDQCEKLDCQCHNNDWQLKSSSEFAKLRRKRRYFVHLKKIENGDWWCINHQCHVNDTESHLERHRRLWQIQHNLPKCIPIPQKEPMVKPPSLKDSWLTTPAIAIPVSLKNAAMYWLPYSVPI